MKREWTEEQKRVITERNKDILVSAAAGSGKTAVLVERIMGKILDKEHPVDVDRILVVTFTNAAAKEMKERLRTELIKRSREDPGNDNLFRQTALVSSSNIKTIDSFCLDIIRNHFSKIDLDPSFRIGDEREMILLRNDVMNKIFEDHYDRGDKDFLYVSDILSRKNTDEPFKEQINLLYDYAMSYPWPNEFLDDSIRYYDITDKDSLLNSKLFKFFISHLKTVLLSLSKRYDEALDILRFLEGGEDLYKFMLDEKERLFILTEENEDTEGFLNDVLNFDFRTFPRKDRELSDDTKETVKKIRDETKKSILKYVSDEIKKAGSIDEILRRNALIRPYAKTLIDITKEFYDSFSREKRKKNIIDYSDMEHLSLSILIDEKTKEKTDTAREYSDFFDEIMIDEYQDSNFVQELILKSVSKEGKGYNYFCVGDVKQSIYRFRLARPELFMEKYESYDVNGEGEKIRIDLNKNFRSRIEVLNSVNKIFKDIMRFDIGGIDYTEKEALYLGNKGFKEASSNDADPYKTEVLLIEDDKDLYDDLSVYNSAGYEGEIISDKIKELVGKLLINDPSDNTVRPLCYKDIVILLRSPKSRALPIAESLKRNDIPVYYENSEGYFDTPEVNVLLSFLSLLDNKLQDIPLTAVLLSPMFSFTEEELFIIKDKYKKSLDENKNKIRFYEAFFSYEYPSDDELKSELDKKVKRFNETFDRIRSLVFDTPLFKIIDLIFEETGYLNYVTAEKNGERRRENLLFLYDLSIDYEDTGYKGLFRFMRYIERLKKVLIDFGEAELLSENDDVVRIMSIHKSKGLEFPVVFTSCLGGLLRGNRGEKILFSESFGVGLPCIDGEKRIEFKSFLSNVIKIENRIEEMGEELRILYVALTRAKEKLILTGCVKDINKLLNKNHSLNFHDILYTSSFLDLIMESVRKNRDDFIISVVTPKEKAFNDTLLSLEQDKRKRDLLKKIDDIKKNKKEDGFDFFSYKRKNENNYKIKYSVSETKKINMPSSFLKEIETEDEFEETIPLFIKGDSEDEKSGAAAGTATHRFLECFDFSLDEPEKNYESELLRILSKKRMTKDQAKLLNKEKIERFLSSDLSKRMGNADRNHDLFKEKAFIFSEKADALFSDGGDDDLLVQGIIDVFFIEDKKAVLLDYKTDRVREEKELIERYEKQLLLYKNAIERAFKIEVKETYIYSFSLNKEILLFK